MSKKEKVLNFLFPGDVIEIEVPEILRKREGLNLIERFTIIKSSYKKCRKLYYVRISKNYNIYFDLVINLSSLSVKLGTYITGIMNYFNIKYINIIKRGSLFYNNSNYCSYICPMKSKNLCDGNDWSCEYYDGDKYKNRTLLLGDRLKYFLAANQHIKGKYYCCGSVCDLEFVDKESWNSTRDHISVSMETRVNTLLTTVKLISGTRFELFEHNCTVITTNQCKLCVLDNNCSSCYVNILKKLNIIDKSSIL